MEEEDGHFPTQYSPPPPLSLKQKIKQSLCFSCFFRRRHHPLNSPPPPNSDAKSDLMWLKPNHSRHHHSDDFKDKCKAILGRVSNPTNKHRRHSSTEFRYDPLSYSLNFEDGFGDSQLDEAPLKNFSARLPHSPSPSQPPSAGKEVAVN